MAASKGARMYGFQSTRPRGRTRRGYIVIVSGHNGFNPRVLAGGRDSVPSRNCAYTSVSIHASSREDATFVIGYLENLKRFQSTRPRGRTRLDHAGTHSGIEVSIHASSREDATQFFQFLFPEVVFQSTRPRGRTRPVLDPCLEDGSVSIHASSREDATDPLAVVLVGQGFNPRVLAGGRDQIARKLDLAILFQSTRPRGRTRPPAWYSPAPD